MPTTPYAKILTSVNGAGAVAGYAGDVAGGSTIQLSAESTSGWENVRWEIFGYPEDWPTPTGWTLESSGLIVSTDYTPDLITLEDEFTRFGKWLPRLVVNGRTKNGVVDHPEMVDETAGWEVLSPGLELRELALLEGGQADALRRWIKSIQRNLRKFEAAAGTGPAFSGRTATTDATATTVATVAIPDNSNVTIEAYAGAKKAATTGKAFFAYRQKYYRNGAGPVAWGTSPVDLGVDADGNPWTVTFVISGNNVLVKVTGQAATNLTWKWQVKTLIAED